MNIIKRYSAPNKMDQCPRGTICIVNSMLYKSRILFEQTNEDWEKPIWVEIPENPEIIDPNL